MKKKKSSVLMLAILGGISALSAQSNPVKQTTPEYIYPVFRNVLKMAEENSLQYEKLDISLLNAKYSLAISKSNRLPDLNLSTGIGAYWSNYENSAGETQGVQVGVNDLSLSSYYSIYDWGSKQANHRIADKRFQDFLLTYERRMGSIARDLRVRFLQLIIDKFSLKTLELEVAINQANINEDTIRYEQGRLSAENYERSMNSRKSRILDLENLRLRIDRSIEDFNTAVGIEKAITLEDIPTNIPSIQNINEQLLSLAKQCESKDFSDIPGVQQAKLSLDIAEENIINAKSASRPRIGLSSGINLDVEPTQDNQRVISFRAGLGFRWSIYSGGANTKRMLRSLNDRTNQLIDYRELMRNVKTDLDRIIEDLKYHYNKLELAESEYQLALQSYEKSKDEYDRGRVSELQFLNIELRRLYQERSIYNSRKDYIIRVSDFLNTIGKDPVLDILTRPDEKDLSYITEKQ